MKGKERKFTLLVGFEKTSSTEGTATSPTKGGDRGGGERVIEKGKRNHVSG